VKPNVLLVALLCLASFAAGAAPTYINGRSFTSLTDWARNYGFAQVGFQRKGELEFTNRTGTLIFNVDSRTAQVNGVNVALSYPITNFRETAMIAQPDLDTALRPLLHPPFVPIGKKAFTICLDPGHGGKDSGNRVTFHFEKIYTLALASELKDQLNKCGFNVILTRTKDQFVELPVRPDIANRRGADLFISLHFNATEVGRDEVQGPETYCITPVGASSTNARGEGANYGPTPANRVESRSVVLAYQVQKSLVRNLSCPDRGVRRARFAVLRDAEMPAILIESGYMTHPVEGRKIFDSNYRRQLALAIARGIQNYEKLISPVPEKPSLGNR
jgi:N-acetylmuramoyl-L-alanine amidase